jgi:hypothetical protein
MSYRGRRFHPITDHKASEEIRAEERFGNDRVCVMEKIQEHDFSVECGKGEELLTADALSRLYEEDRNNLERERGVESEQGEEIKKRNLDKHVIEISGRKCWRFDSWKMRKIPETSERKKLVIETREELIHRGTDAVYYKFEAKWYLVRDEGDDKPDDKKIRSP